MKSANISPRLTLLVDGTGQLPPECNTGTCNVRQGLFFPSVSPLNGSPPAAGNSVDYVSVPLELDGDYVPSLSFVLKPPQPNVEYMVMLSNCAYVVEDGQEGKINHFVADEVTFTWR